jgi:hypothetical protein
VRTFLGFIIAPLAVPLLGAIWIPNPLVLFAAIPVGYGGMAILGLPLYFGLRGMGWTSGWIAAPLGALCGMVTWVVTIALLGLLPYPGFRGDGGFRGAYAAINDIRWENLWPCAGIGATVAIMFWLIARPGRPRMSN